MCPTLCNPMDCSPAAPLSLRFSRQEYWSGLLCCPPGDLPNPGIEPGSPALLADSLASEPQGKSKTEEFPDCSLKARAPCYIPISSMWGLQCSTSSAKLIFLRAVLMWTIFRAFIEFVTILLLFYVLFCFGLKVCRILVPQPGIKPVLLALEG